MSKDVECIGLICGIILAIIIGLVVITIYNSEINAAFEAQITKAIPGFDSIIFIVTSLFLFPLFLLLIKKRMEHQSQ